MKYISLPSGPGRDWVGQGGTNSCPVPLILSLSVNTPHTEKG